MFYDNLKKKFKNEIIFLNTNERNNLKFDETKEKILFCEGCWEAISKEEIEKINSYKICFMNMHPNTQYRIPLQSYIEFKPMVDFNDRDIDIFYCGESMKSFSWINNESAIICEQSTWSRLNMIANSLMIKNKKIVMLPQPHWGGTVQKEEYSDMMSRCKIALCPIGSTWESHRITEAALYGCVIVTTPFNSSLFPFGGNIIPNYLKNAPFIFVDKDWKNLPKIINELSNEKLIDIHQKTLKWANEYLSEDAIIQQVSNLYKD